MKNCRYCGTIIDGAVSSCPECVEPSLQRSNDNYYGDVLPEDDGQRNKKKNNTGAAFKIGLTIFGVVLVIAACIAVLSII